MTTSQPPTAIYVYCITEGQPLRADAGLHPLRAVFSIVHHHLVAVASRVPLEEFGPEALSSHLADPAWLEREARGHEAVIENVMETRAVLPLRFCTIFRSEAGVTALLRSRQPRFSATLALLRGKQEWEVKLFMAPAPADADPPESEPAGLSACDAQPGALSGRDYLLSKATARLRASAAISRAHGDAQRCLEEVASWVEDLRLRPSATGGSLDQAGLIWDAVCLLAQSRAASFCQRLEALGHELSGRGLLLRASGPWPPYHFTPTEGDHVSSPAPD